MLGADATQLDFQVGADTTQDDTVSIKTTDMTKDAKITAVTNTSTAVISAAATSGAIGAVNDTRAAFGATQSRFDSIISNLQSSVESRSAAKSRIMDADFAAETANMSRANVLQQAGMAMIAQANRRPQAVLALLR